MGKQQQRGGAPRRTWNENLDKLDGIVRDPTTGVVLARRSRHPLADVFRSVPAGPGLPGLRMPDEAEHLLALHLFDNLGAVLGKRPLYKARPDEDMLHNTGRTGVLWVPASAPDPSPPVAVEEETAVADISHYDDAQVELMGRQVREIKTARKKVGQSDTGEMT